MYTDYMFRHWPAVLPPLRVRWLARQAPKYYDYSVANPSSAKRPAMRASASRGVCGVEKAGGGRRCRSSGCDGGLAVWRSTE